MATVATERAGPGRPSTGARERILAGCLEVLKSDGYAGLTTAKVAAASGESKALIAYHFGSKHGLVAAAGHELGQTITAKILAGIGDARSAEEIVRGAFDGAWAILEDDPRLPRVYFDLNAVSVVEPEIRRTIAEVNEQWRDVLVRLLTEADDGLTPAKARVLTVMVIAGMQGMTLERIERGPTPERKRARELFIRSAVATAG